MIAIIGILASIALISWQRTRERARNAQRQSDIVNLVFALEMYHDEQDPPQYPASLVALGAYFPGGIPLRDPQNNLYCYTPGGALVLDNYTICTMLEGPDFTETCDAILGTGDFCKEAN